MLVRLVGAARSYGTKVKTRALSPIDLELGAGEVTLLLGPSGSGKTTLLNLVGALDHPSEGKVVVDGRDLAGLSRRELTLFRREVVGFVFQFFNLVPSLTARENVQVAGELTGGSAADARRWLDRVGLAAEADRFPSELSGGQQQRVAVARALAKRPRLLLADEPTGALDHDNGRQVARLLRDASTELGCAVVIVTHDEDLVELADRVVRLRDGAIASDERQARS
ncbi:MAG TPA: ABC transporter ATP-binding protein [Kofleriaceae bacterium]|nr:ABC transporter ATP-binding protein [Kofleriaceae bacterium]